MVSYIIVPEGSASSRDVARIYRPRDCFVAGLHRIAMRFEPLSLLLFLTVADRENGGQLHVHEVGADSFEHFNL